MKIIEKKRIPCGLERTLYLIRGEMAVDVSYYGKPGHGSGTSLFRCS
jgi:hypothetical protein